MNKTSKTTNRKSLPIAGTTIRDEVPKTFDSGSEKSLLDGSKNVTEQPESNPSSSALEKAEDKVSEIRDSLKDFKVTPRPFLESPELYCFMVKFNNQVPRIYVERNQRIIFNSAAVSKFSLRMGGYAVLFYSYDDLSLYIGIKSSISEALDPAAYRLTPGQWPGSLCITCPEFIYLLQLRHPLPIKGLALNWDPEKNMILAFMRGIESYSTNGLS